MSADAERGHSPFDRGTLGPVSPTGLFPRGGPRPTLSHAEKAMYRALASGLPKGWTAWHSLRVRAKSTWEGEGDFVLAVPDRGALVLEIKGGAIEVRDGIWLQNGRSMERVPRDQAHGFSRLLRTKLGERSDGPVPYVAIATAFPDTAFKTEPSHADTEGAILGAQDLLQLGTTLERVAAEVFPRDSVRVPRDARWIDALHSMWGETWTPRLALGDRARLREEELVALDAAQLALLDEIGHNPRFLVSGGPGTGKTLLARDLCSRSARAGKRARYLCSTRALATALRAGGLETASTVRDAAVALLATAGISMQGGAPPSEWTSETWDLATLQAAADASEGAACDVVVVDEAQDLLANDWELVKALAGKGALWAFGDAGQSFWPDRRVPAGLFPASLGLRSRYRCPEALAAFADTYRSPTAPVSDNAALHDCLRVVRVPSAGAAPERLGREIEKALGDGAAPQDVAVLSLAGLARTAVCAGERIGRTPVVRADDPSGEDHVIADTFLRFKGLERPWILLTELSLAQGRDDYDVRMHIALTRGTVGCVIVATAEEIAADPRLAALVAARSS